MKQKKAIRDKAIFSLKKIIEEQKQEIHQLKTIIDDLPGDIYWKTRKEDQLVYSGMNRTGIESLAKMGFSWTIEDIIGKTDAQLFDKETAAIFVRNDWEVIKTATVRTTEESAILPSGKKIIQLSTKRPLFDKRGHSIGVVGVSVNITELKETQTALHSALEKANAANLAKTEFLENMRHDIRTPLNGIIGCAQIIQSSTHDPKKVLAYSKTLIQSAEVLLDFLNDVLNNLQITTGALPLIKKKLDIRQQLEHIVALNRSLAAEKNLELVMDVDKHIPPYLIGDPMRVQRIVLELIANALLFTEKGQVNLIVQLKKREGKEIVLAILVKDTGIGIPQDKQEEIFFRFKRLTPSYQGHYKGLGLGLSLVKQFIDDLNAEIYVKSVIGQGTTFLCLIPFQEPLVMDDEGLANPSFIFSVPPTQKKKRRLNRSKTTKPSTNPILLIEDDALAAKIIQTLLSELGYAVDTAYDAKTTVEKLQKQPRYQLLLMDIGLPDMDGIALTQRIRKNRLVHASVPIIGLTAHIGDEKKQQCLEAGMNAIQLKPLKKETVLECLSFFLQKTTEINLPPAEDLKGAVLDFNIIKTLLVDDALIEECRNLMITEITADLKKVKKYYEAADWVNIKAIAHKWQGAASYYGAKRLEHVCKTLNGFPSQRAPNKKRDQWYQLLVQEMNAVKEVCKKRFIK